VGTIQIFKGLNGLVLICILVPYRDHWKFDDFCDVYY